MKSPQQQTYYELLDIPPNADQASIVDAYKKARSTYNPNSPALYTIFTKQEAEELVKLIDEAYNILSNQYKRSEYDKKIRARNIQPATAVATHQAEAPQPVATSPLSYNVDPQFEEKIQSEVDFSGSFLQQVRLYKKISIDQIADATKIGRPYLNAIESQDYSFLPAPVFLRGFIVQYAKYLGLDGNKVAQAYLKNIPPGSKK